MTQQGALSAWAACHCLDVNSVRDDDRLAVRQAEVVLQLAAHVFAARNHTPCLIAALPFHAVDLMASFAGNVDLMTAAFSSVNRRDKWRLPAMLEGDAGLGD